MPQPIAKHYQEDKINDHQEPFIKLYEMSERPMTSKSVSSISNNNFRI